MATKKEKAAVKEGQSQKIVERVPGAWDLENKQKHVLKFLHVPTGYNIKMPAFLDSLSDAYTSEWSEQTAYGRMDSMAFFGGTRRNISVAWNIPADSFEHAQSNLAKINALINFLYPLYDVKKGGDPVINMDPLLRLSFGNLIRNPKTGTGLLGYVNGITFDPVLEEGMFHGKPTWTPKGSDTAVSRGSSLTAIRAGQSARERERNWARGGNPQNNMYYPKTVRLNVEFKVLHEHSLGYAMGTEPDKNGKAKASYSFTDPRLNHANFPYTLPSSQQVKNFKLGGGQLLDSQTRGDPQSVGSVVQAEGFQEGEQDSANAANIARNTDWRNRNKALIDHLRGNGPKPPGGTP